MSRFYASIQGGRGEATRQGTAKSGIRGHIHGFHFGVSVHGRDGDEDDVFSIRLTGGIRGASQGVCLGDFEPGDLDSDIVVIKGDLPAGCVADNAESRVADYAHAGGWNEWSQIALLTGFTNKCGLAAHLGEYLAEHKHQEDTA